MERKGKGQGWWGVRGTSRKCPFEMRTSAVSAASGAGRSGGHCDLGLGGFRGTEKRLELVWHHARPLPSGHLPPAPPFFICKVPSAVTSEMRALEPVPRWRPVCRSWSRRAPRGGGRAGKGTALLGTLGEAGGRAGLAWPVCDDRRQLQPHARRPPTACPGPPRQPGPTHTGVTGGLRAETGRR